MQMTRERDEAMRLAENREAARVRALFQAKLREQELVLQIAHLQLDVHRLNNMINPISQPIPADPEDEPSEEEQNDGMVSKEESEEDLQLGYDSRFYVLVPISLCVPDM